MIFIDLQESFLGIKKLEGSGENQLDPQDPSTSYGKKIPYNLTINKIDGVSILKPYN